MFAGLTIVERFVAGARIGPIKREDTFEALLTTVAGTATTIACDLAT